MTDEPTTAESALARQVLATLRPQEFGRGEPHRVVDPLVEPLWAGIRVLAAVDDGDATLVDADGEAIEGMEAIVEGIAAAGRANGLVVDGFLTKQTIHQVGAMAPWPDEMPSISRLIGVRLGRGKDPLTLKEQDNVSMSFSEDDELSFVAVDLLWLDGSSLLDVPLLERRRLLESVLAESDVVRLGAFVRPPIDTWVASWRMQGFGGITFKAANSRYLPGQPNPEWAVSGMPRR
jgi:ATP dependent DNA ligase domain